MLRELCDNVSRAKEAMDRGSVNQGLELVGRELGMFVQRTMAIESPLQRLPADRLLALLALVDEAVWCEQVTTVPALQVATRPEPVTIEGETAAEDDQR